MAEFCRLPQVINRRTDRYNPLMIKNKDGAKHAAQTLRIVGIAQFAHYGVRHMDYVFDGGQALLFFLISASAFIVMEVVGIHIINFGNKNNA